MLATNVEHGVSLWARFMGLMGRPPLAQGNALWLPGTNGIHMFFMRFPIDAVFMAKPLPDGSRRVLSVHRGVRPWVGLVPFIPGASGVLELPVGAIRSSGSEVGDRVSIA